MIIDQIQLEPGELDGEGRPQARGYFRLEYERCVQYDTVEKDAQKRIEDLVDAASLDYTVGHPSSISVTLENKEELKAHGLPVPVAFCATLPIEWSAPPLSKNRLQAAFHDLAALPQEKRSFHHHVSRWIRRLYNDKDPFDRFMSLWIAFNVLYDRPYYQRSEQGAIRLFINDTFDLTASQTLIQGKIAYDSIKLMAESGLKLRNRPIADELKAALESLDTTGDQINILVLLTLTLYAIRNAIVHGDLVDEDCSHRKLVGTAHDVLKSIIYDALHRCLGLSVPLNT